MARRIALAGSLVRQVLQIRANRMTTVLSVSSGPSSASSSVDISYITNRLDNVFNIILSDIQSSPNPKNVAMFQDPYKHKDKILQELVRNEEFNSNYNIQDLIEQEFSLEISDQEFAKFQSLADIAQYVKNRLEIRQKIPLKTHYANLHLNY